MTTPNYSIIFSAQLVGSSTVSIGQVLIPSATTAGRYAVSTTAERGTRRSEGIATTAYGGAGTGSVQLQQSGTIDATISGLAAGIASWVRCSATGTIERVTPSGSDDIIGYAEANGRVHLMFGILTAAMASSTLLGDVTGTLAASVVSAVRGATVATAGGALTIGNVLKATAASTLDYGAVNLAGGSGHVINVLPPANGGSGGGSDGQFFGNNGGVPTWRNVATSYGVGSGTLATVGGVRFDSTAQALVATRNTANTADLSILEKDGSNNLYVGADATLAAKQVASIFIYPTTETVIGGGGGTSARFTNAGVALVAPLGGAQANATQLRLKTATVTLTNGAVFTTLSAAQYECPFLAITGGDASSLGIILPLGAGAYLNAKQLSVAASVTIKGTSGAGVALATGKQRSLRCNVGATDYEFMEVP